VYAGCVVEDRADLIALQLADKVPLGIEPASSRKRLSLWTRFLISILAKMPMAQVVKLSNHFSGVILGNNN
jgi:hypothetical protein